jgi:hypothetical protein
LRFFEIIIGFCIANAWCIYLANHKKKSDPKYLTRASFQISLTKHFWDHNYSHLPPLTLTHFYKPLLVPAHINPTQSGEVLALETAQLLRIDRRYAV